MNSHTKNKIFILALFGGVMGYGLYNAWKEIEHGNKEVYKYPNIVIKKTPDSLVLRDVKDNKERIYLHNLSAKTYCNLKENDTVYFHNMKYYDKDSVFRAYTETAFRTKQR